MPFDVLLDEDGDAAEIVGTRKMTTGSLLKPSQVFAGARALAKGNIQRNPGRRPFQLGATLVIGPGDQLLYEDFEDFAGDHADIDDVLKAIQSG